MLSRRGKKLLEAPPSLVKAHFMCLSDPYDSAHNPQGYINLGTAENHLLWDVLAPKLAVSPGLPHQTIHYDYLYGSLSFRKALAQYLLNGTGVSVDPEHIIVAAGASAVVDMMASALCDPGDGILIPAPYYPGFDVDLRMRSEVIPVPVPLCDKNDFQLSIADFEQALTMAGMQGLPVKAVLLSSPNNPLGRLYSEALLREIIEFCDRHQLACIVDEIYMNSIHGDTPFVSALRLVEGNKNVHIINGLAKDFCISGFKIGFAWSPDLEVIHAMQALSHVHPASTQTQFLLTPLLNDIDWVDAFMRENRKRLRHAYNTVTQGLEALGISFAKAEAGFFVFLNLRAAMAEDSFEGEQALWRKLFEENHLNLAPGAAFHYTEPGWFRLCFAKPDDVLYETVRRIGCVLK